MDRSHVAIASGAYTVGSGSKCAQLSKNLNDTFEFAKITYEVLLATFWRHGWYVVL